MLTVAVSVTILVLASIVVLMALTGYLNEAQRQDDRADDYEGIGLPHHLLSQRLALYGVDDLLSPPRSDDNDGNPDAVDGGEGCRGGVPLTETIETNSRRVA